MAQKSPIVQASDGRRYPFWDYTKKPGPNAGCNQAWMQMRRLNKGDSCTLPASLKALQMGLRWDKGKDVDCSVALFDERMQNVDLVWFRQLKSNCGSVVHSGDNITGEGDGYEESVNINLSALPVYIHYLMFIVTVHTSSTVFNQVENLEVEMRYGDNPAKGDDLFTMSLSNSSDEAMLVGQLIRKGPEWSFAALGEGTQGKDPREVLQDGAIGEYLSRFPSVAVVVRDISICVLEGKDLAAKDISFLGRDPTSDPYYVVNFQGQETRSEVQRQTLNPVWSRRLIELGSVKEGETDLLEISLYDRDLIKSDDFMGVMKVSAGELHALGAGEHKFWFELNESDQARYGNDAVSGEILVEISVKESEVSRRCQS